LSNGDWSTGAGLESKRAVPLAQVGEQKGAPSISPNLNQAKHLQVAYASLQKSLQAEWKFLQRVTEGIDVEFSGIEHELSSKFLPALFGKESLTHSQRQD
jgi:hypothetical protein